jgi:tetratricopeptide (TPR) repeat protein
VSLATTPELEARSLNNQGELLFRRASIFLSRADNGRLTASEKAKEFSKARGFLKQSLEKYGAAKATYKSLVDNFKLDVRDPESKQKQKLLRGTYTVVRVKLPQILEKYADTLEDNDPEREQNLSAAAKDFEQLWLKYPNFPAGFDSCLYAARCNYKLGDYPEALTFLQRIFGLPSNSRLARLKRRAYVLAADCWSSMEKYPYDDVIANFEPLVVNLSRRDQASSDWQRVNLELAKAYHAKATELKAEYPSVTKREGIWPNGI